MPRSPKNTRELPKEPLEALPQNSIDLPDVKTTPVDEALEKLQNEVLAEKDGRREERWVWFAVVCVMFDAATFPSMGNWVAPIAIVFLEVVILAVLGRKWGVDPIWTLTEMIINKWTGHIK